MHDSLCYMSAAFIFYGLITIKLVMAIGVAVVYLRFFNTAAGLKQMTPLDIIVNFLLSAILSDFILDKHISILDFVVVVLIYGMLLYILNRVTFNTDLGRRIFIGSPRIIIQNGEIDEEEMSRLHISAHDLALALRRQQIKSIKDVEMAQIEPNGDFTIVRKGAKKYSIVIIDNGNIDEVALAKIHRSETWLRRELQKRKINDIDEILVAQWHNNRLQIVKKKDQI
ncbi:DUF421 domain-containing protein [bacterium]|nr:DUF421 domain-containing protein [bacterium]